MDQYHEEKGGQKSVINLGRFDLKNHKKYLEENPNKRPKLPLESRKHVSHFYSNGDICDLTGNYILKLKLKHVILTQRPCNMQPLTRIRFSIFEIFIAYYFGHGA